MTETKDRLFICLDNTGYEVSLERRKIYIALPDDGAEKHGQLRIIDESGEDYVADLPQAVHRRVLESA